MLRAYPTRISRSSRTKIRVPRTEDLDFLRSADARTIRVLAELLEPQFRLDRHDVEDTIVFFGSSRIGPDLTVAAASELAELTPYYEAARSLARCLTQWSQKRTDARRFVVCSGGGPGIMEAANRGAQEAGGPSIGFGVQIPFEEEINPYVTPELAFQFHYFFLRKFWFVYNAKALVFFPSGYGTMDELMEVLALVQTRKVRKKLGIVLYGEECWRSMIDFDAMLRHGVISTEDRDLFVMVDRVDAAFDQICAFLEANYGTTLLQDL